MKRCRDRQAFLKLVAGTYTPPGAPAIALGRYIIYTGQLDGGTLIENYLRECSQSKKKLPTKK